MESVRIDNTTAKSSYFNKLEESTIEGVKYMVQAIRGVNVTNIIITKFSNLNQRKESIARKINCGNV
ncbi:phosphatase [Wolbachia endosymbiont of Onchocerca ochengi]|uniref:hypothetical protein n=1 Tax=Wolbachia endosymbiont of Onchocerca ochengi TaxID=100901 RepID=UPI00026DA6B8|nr:hypothetical protein [Wolbachia endosymbiont of Onchocerca ochengi]CCF78180.1 phosphatase [Wolbachia endosymbiont of Onchocerca ochengi]